MAYAGRGSERRERYILAQGLVIAAVIYVVFAAIWGDLRWIGIEVLGVVGYGVLAWLGLRHSPYWIALGWAAHPLWDVALHFMGPGQHIVPAWYAIACVSFDILVGAAIVWRTARR